MSLILLLITISPLLFYLVDGYYEKNIRKGVYMILGFLSLMALSVIATKNMGWYIIGFVPVFFTTLVLFKIVKSK
ncbi:MAG: hypothetical protein J0L86_12735 [Flavobacteriales bacterium]|nr:hypothetical protein [Flavobacteriales bacterium]